MVAGRALLHFYAGQMEGPLQLAVSRRLPRPSAGPNPRYVTRGYRRSGKALALLRSGKRMIKRRQRRAPAQMQENTDFVAVTDC